jgi:hypothetical protein
VSGLVEYLFNELGDMVQRGYQSKSYPNGTVCNASGDTSCGDPHGSGGPRAKWGPASPDSRKLSVRAFSSSAEINLDTGIPTFGGYQVGGASFRIGESFALGWVSDQYAPMLKVSVPYGLIVGGEASFSIGFNGIKLSAGFAGGHVGKVGGTFPRNTVGFGAGSPGVSIGIGRQ